MSVLENEMNDPGVAPLINHSRNNQSYEIHILFDQPTHAPKWKCCCHLRTYLSPLSGGGVGDLLCLVSLLIKNVGVIFSFDKNKTELDRWLLVWYNKQQPLFWLLYGCVCKCHICFQDSV